MEIYEKHIRSLDIKQSVESMTKLGIASYISAILNRKVRKLLRDENVKTQTRDQLPHFGERPKVEKAPQREGTRAYQKDPRRSDG